MSIWLAILLKDVWVISVFCFQPHNFMYPWLLCLWFLTEATMPKLNTKAPMANTSRAHGNNKPKGPKGKEGQEIQYQPTMGNRTQDPKINLEPRLGQTQPSTEGQVMNPKAAIVATMQVNKPLVGG